MCSSLMLDGGNCSRSGGCFRSLPSLSRVSCTLPCPALGQAFQPPSACPLLGGLQTPQAILGGPVPTLRPEGGCQGCGACPRVGPLARGPVPGQPLLRPPACQAFQHGGDFRIKAGPCWAESALPRTDKKDHGATGGLWVTFQPLHRCRQRLKHISGQTPDILTALLRPLGRSRQQGWCEGGC